MKLLVLTTALIALASIVAALPTNLAHKAGNPETKLGFNVGEKRLIKLNSKDEPKWLSAAEIAELYAKKAHFMDITDTPNLAQLRVNTFDSPVIPTQVTQQSIVKPIIANANTNLMKQTLEKLSSFNNRYYKANTGSQSAEYLFSTVKQVVHQR